MQSNDQVVLLNEQFYQTQKTRRKMTIPVGSIGRVEKIHSRPSSRRLTYVKFRGHQSVGLFDTEMLTVPAQ